MFLTNKEGEGEGEGEKATPSMRRRDSTTTQRMKERKHPPESLTFSSIIWYRNLIAKARHNDNAKSESPKWGPAITQEPPTRTLRFLLPLHDGPKHHEQQKNNNRTDQPTEQRDRRQGTTKQKTTARHPMNKKRTARDPTQCKDTVDE